MKTRGINLGFFIGLKYDYSNIYSLIAKTKPTFSANLS